MESMSHEQKSIQLNAMLSIVFLIMLSSLQTLFSPHSMLLMTSAESDILTTLTESTELGLTADRNVKAGDYEKIKLDADSIVKRKAELWQNTNLGNYVESNTENRFSNKNGIESNENNNNNEQTNFGPQKDDEKDKKQREHETELEKKNQRDGRFPQQKDQGANEKQTVLSFFPSLWPTFSLMFFSPSSEHRFSSYREASEISLQTKESAPSLSHRTSEDMPVLSSPSTKSTLPSYLSFMLSALIEFISAPFSENYSDMNSSLMFFAPYLSSYNNTEKMSGEISNEHSGVSDSSQSYSVGRSDNEEKEGHSEVDNSSIDISKNARNEKKKLNRQIQQQKKSDGPVIKTYCYGNIHQTAYYFSDLVFGNPPIQRQSLILDTGSSVMGFPCTNCHSCGEHVDPAFDCEKSSSCTTLPCESRCSYCDAKQRKCAYRVAYMEGSALQGFWNEDEIYIPRSPPIVYEGENPVFDLEGGREAIKNRKGNAVSQHVPISSSTQRLSNGSRLLSISNSKETSAPPSGYSYGGPTGLLYEGVRMPFGCHAEETQLFVTQKASGILGLELWSQFGPPTFMESILFKQKNAPPQGLFSMCLSENGGSLTIGDRNTEWHKKSPSASAHPFDDKYETVRTPIIPMQETYSVMLVGIEIERKSGENIRIPLKAPRLTRRSQSSPASLRSRLGLETNIEVLIDSGTTLTYLPAYIYEGVVKAIEDDVKYTNNLESTSSSSSSSKKRRLSKRATNEFAKETKNRLEIIPLLHSMNLQETHRIFDNRKEFVSERENGELNEDNEVIHPISSKEIEKKEKQSSAPSRRSGRTLQLNRSSYENLDVENKSKSMNFNDNSNAEREIATELSYGNEYYPDGTKGDTNSDYSIHDSPPTRNYQSVPTKRMKVNANSERQHLSLSSNSRPSSTELSYLPTELMSQHSSSKSKFNTLCFRNTYSKKSTNNEFGHEISDNDAKMIGDIFFSGQKHELHHQKGKFAKLSVKSKHTNQGVQYDDISKQQRQQKYKITRKTEKINERKAKKEKTASDINYVDQEDYTSKGPQSNSFERIEILTADNKDKSVVARKTENDIDKINSDEVSINCKRNNLSDTDDNNQIEVNCAMESDKHPGGANDELDANFEEERFFEEAAYSLLPKSAPPRVSKAVKMDSQSGELCWYLPKGDKELHTFPNILLYFAPLPEELILNNSIHENDKRNDRRNNSDLNDEKLDIRSDDGSSGHDRSTGIPQQRYSNNYHLTNVSSNGNIGINNSDSSINNNVEGKGNKKNNYTKDRNKQFVRWKPRSYLYAKGNSHYRCLAISEDTGNDKSAVLGSSFFINNDIVFDLEKHIIEFIDSTCPSIHIRDRPRQEDIDQIIP